MVMSAYDAPGYVFNSNFTANTACYLSVGSTDNTVTIGNLHNFLNAYSENGYLPGDINGDGVFDYNDVLALYDCYSNDTPLTDLQINNFALATSYRCDAIPNYNDILALYDAQIASLVN